MKEKILAFLKTKLAGFAGGVEEGFLLEYADHFSKSITEETQIATSITDGAIDQMKVAYGFYNKEVVNKAKKAQETALKNFREKHGLDENGKPVQTDPKPGDPKPGDPNPDSNEPAWAKQLREQQEALNAKLEKAEKEKANTALAAKVKGHENLKGIPDWYLAKCNLVPESEDKIEQLTTSIKTEWETARQSMVEAGVVWNIPPASGGKAVPGKALGEEIAEKRNTKTSDGVEKVKLGSPSK